MTEYIYEQSGVIPYRHDAGQVQLLVIRSSDGLRWVMPKGMVEPDLTPRESAAKEALEEAGICGSVSIHAVGSYRYRKWGGTCMVEMFLMQVQEELQEWEEDHRIREWVSFEEAVARVNAQGLKELLVRMRELVGE